MEKGKGKMEDGRWLRGIGNRWGSIKKKLISQ